MIKDLEGVQQTLSKYSYELKNLIGSGSFGSVYVCYSHKYRQEFAIKIMNLPTKDASSEEEDTNSKVRSVEQAACEIETLMNLSHPYIISMYNYFKDEKHLYIVLEYCSGGNLQSYVEKNGPISGFALISLTKAILLALSHCHNRNIVHRDIKPANILIDKYGRARLADFGISNIIGDKRDISYFNAVNQSLAISPSSPQSKNFRVAGSLAYMPPESQNGTIYDLKQADIWSLGMTLYYVSAGNLPWETKNYSELLSYVKMGMIIYPPYVNVDYVKFLKRMLITIPKKRATIDALLDDHIFPKAELRPKNEPSINHLSTLQLPNLSNPTLEPKTSAPITSFPSVAPIGRKMSLGPSQKYLIRAAFNKTFLTKRKPSYPEENMKRGISTLTLPKKQNF